MPSPTERTLEVFARSDSETASQLLLESIGRTDRIGLEAISVISRFGSRRAKFELVRRAEELSTGQRDLLHGRTAPFADAVSQAIIGPSDDDRSAAYKWIDVATDFEQYGLLLERQLTAEGQEPGAIAETLESLTERMFDLFDGREQKLEREFRQLRDIMFDVMIRQLDKIEQHPDPERLIEWALILAATKPGDSNRVVAAVTELAPLQLSECLLNSVHPGILRTSLDLMRKTYPHDIAFELLGTRADQPFLYELLDTFPKELTPNQESNLKRVQSLPWITDDLEVVATLPRRLHGGLLRLLHASGLPEATKQRTVRWLLQNSDPETRELASGLFNVLAQPDSHEILLSSLDDDDQLIEAWATSKLRNQSVPNAAALLIEKLDSSSPNVRETAQEQLSEINLRYALDLLDTDPDRVTPALGILLKKIHPDLDMQLRVELAHPIRVRRVNAIRLCGALGVVGQVLSGISALVDDPDTLVRRTVVEVLGHTPNREAFNALMRATGDKSPRVRQAAAEALQYLRELFVRKQQQPEPDDVPEVSESEILVAELERLTQLSGEGR